MQAITFETSRGRKTLSHSLTLSSSAHSPLICIHGLVANATLFTALTPYLARDRRSVLTFDWEGFGGSPLSPSTINETVDGVSEYVEDLRGYLLANEINEDRPGVLVGHGEGAYIAIVFAATFPDYVSSLILLSPILPPHTPASHNVLQLYQTLARERTPADFAAGLARLVSQNEVEGVQVAVKSMLMGEFGGQGPTETRGFQRMCKVSIQSPRLRVGQARTSFPPSQAMETAQESEYKNVIDIRSLIIAGDQDSHAPPAVLHSLASALHGTLMSHAKDDLRALLHYGKERMEERRWERETKIVTLPAG
ncbi:hypothetical protein P7C70_g457, partial [Phenoliferia sp. Uapishka_3]